MKIAISSSKKDLNGEISKVFARCPYFVIAQVENGKIKKTEVMENVNANQLGQAGILVAQLMAEKEVKAVIAKDMGPRALNALKQFAITVYYGEGLVRDILQEFAEGKLKKSE